MMLMLVGIGRGSVSDFFVGEKGKLYVEYRQSGSLSSPSSVTVDGYDPSGDKDVDGAAMTEDDTGKFSYYVSFDEAGRWTFYITATDASSNSQIDMIHAWVSALET
jgi:hypothetical protein